MPLSAIWLICHSRSGFTWSRSRTSGFAATPSHQDRIAVAASCALRLSSSLA